MRQVFGKVDQLIVCLPERKAFFLSQFLRKRLAQPVQVLTSENLDLGCSVIERAANDKVCSLPSFV